jgi:hypothetical protein
MFFLMLKDSLDYIGLGFGNEADALHLSMTAWTLKRINFPYFSDILPPGLGRNAARARFEYQP